MRKEKNAAGTGKKTTKTKSKASAGSKPKSGGTIIKRIKEQKPVGMPKGTVINYNTDERP